MTIDAVFSAPALVVGSGVAGLGAALGLGRATLLTSGGLGEAGATPWSKGGVAAAVGRDDSPALHAEDTLRAAAGLAEPRVVEGVTGAAPGWVERLVSWGARFDRGADGIMLGREAGHSRHRIVHARGDGTGAELTRALVARLRRTPGVQVVERVTLVDLLRSDGRVVGALVEEPSGARVAWLAPAVVLATGGYAHLWSATTNPPGSIGSGVVAAARAGAQLSDLEFCQFHPTALDAGSDPMPLLTEALRGAGAVLLDGDGRRFMIDEHPDAELAPRDVVARAVWRRLEQGAVVLDARDVPGVAQRFPAATAAAKSVGLDPEGEVLPVSPAAHYSIGGVSVSPSGRTSLPGLWACGEVAASGLHGANRLASNSLLEGLVYGGRAAEDIGAAASPLPQRIDVEVPLDDRRRSWSASDEVEVRQLMWRDAGLERDGDGLRSALRRLAPLADAAVAGRGGVMASMAALVVEAALLREHSVGCHYRRDQASAVSAGRSFVTPRAVATATIDLAVPATAAA